MSFSQFLGPNKKELGIVSALRELVGSSVILLVFLVPPATSRQAERHERGESSRHHGGGGIGIPGAVGSGFGYGLPYYAVGTPAGIFTYVPPMLLMGPGGPIPVAVDRGPVAPPPPPGLVAPPRDKPPSRPNRKDSARAEQLVVLGDRLFRGNNIKKAEERYLQAARLDPSSAAPLVRLAQIALVRDQFAEAAHRLREAETAQPGWIITAPDVQSLYGEPDEFARHLARLESHLQVHPDDRDAWLVLGAQWYLSGRTARAADVFLRLNDPRRKPDVALAAFLQATNQP